MFPADLPDRTRQRHFFGSKRTTANRGRQKSVRNGTCQNTGIKLLKNSLLYVFERFLTFRKNIVKCTNRSQEKKREQNMELDGEKTGGRDGCGTQLSPGNPLPAHDSPRPNSS